MRHCCRFKPDDIYYLKDTDIFSSRVLSIGFCPICKKPIAELVEWSFNGVMNKQVCSGINANNLVTDNMSDIVYSLKDFNYKKFKAKPYGWVYGINRENKKGKISQFACDFYGNKELIKSN